MSYSYIFIYEWVIHISSYDLFIYLHIWKTHCMSYSYIFIYEWLTQVKIYEWVIHISENIWMSYSCNSIYEWVIHITHSYIFTYVIAQVSLVQWHGWFVFTRVTWLIHTHTCDVWHDSFMFTHVIRHQNLIRTHTCRTSEDIRMSYSYIFIWVIHISSYMKNSLKWKYMNELFI